MPGHRIVVGERLVIGERLVQGGIPDITPSNGWFSNVSGDSAASSITVTIAGLDSGVSIEISIENTEAAIVESLAVNGSGVGGNATVQNGDTLRCDYIAFGGGGTGTTTIRNVTDGNTILNAHSVTMAGE